MRSWPGRFYLFPPKNQAVEKRGIVAAATRNAFRGGGATETNARALELSSRTSSDDVPRASLAVFRRVRS